jgi:pSer/pThr/pTyr-binding forkhead associated (FHA) protein
MTAGSRETELFLGENWIGRSNDCRVQVSSSSASRHHARIVIENGRVILEDGPSRNGTFLKGKRVTKPTPLAIGDEVRVGSTCLTLRYVTPDTPTDPASDP